MTARIENLQEMREFVGGFLEPLHCSSETAYQVCLAVDELFTNIAFYSYGTEEGTATVRLEVKENPKTLIVTVIDQGVPFDPLQREDPDIDASIDDRPIGGLGIFILKETMDHVSYAYRDGKNILQFQKTLPENA